MRSALSLARRMAAFTAATILLAPSAALAAGDAAAGQRTFALCAGCHSSSPGVNKIGPSLAGVIGRRSGTEAGYTYSPAMQGASITWDDATLDKFLMSPGSTVHGTKMFFSVPGASDRQNIVAYLATLK